MTPDRHLTSPAASLLDFCLSCTGMLLEKGGSSGDEGKGKWPIGGWDHSGGLLGRGVAATDVSVSCLLPLQEPPSVRGRSPRGKASLCAWMDVGVLGAGIRDPIKIRAFLLRDSPAAALEFLSQKDSPSSCPEAKLCTFSSFLRLLIKELG